MAKILVLGGAGEQGSTVVKDMVENGIEEIVIADYNLEAAEELADSLKDSGSEISAVFVDANDQDQLLSVIKDGDYSVVCNLIGPYYKFGEPVMKAVIESGYPYTDINDDWEPSKEIFDAYEESGEKYDVPVFIGCGSSPGVSNMLAKYGSLQMDETKNITIAWLCSTMAVTNTGVLDHMLNIFKGECIQHIDGVTQSVPAGEGERYIESADGIYKGYASYIGHGEPVTLPRYIDAENIVCLGGMHPEDGNKVLFGLNDAGLNTSEPIIIDGKETTRLQVASDILIDTYKDNKSATENNGFLGIRVDGIKDGKKKSLQYENREGNPTGQMTAFTCSIITQMIANGEITQTGLHAPEVLEKEQIEKVLKELEKREYFTDETELEVD